MNLNSIPADVLVPFFFGALQKSVPTEFMRAALNLGQRFVPIDIEGHGTNAVDFHKGLLAYLNSRFGNKLTEPELQTDVDRLVAEKKVTKADGALGYDL